MLQVHGKLNRSVAQFCQNLIKQTHKKTLNSGQHQKDLRRYQWSRNMFRTPSWKKNFEEQSNRTVDDGRTQSLPKLESDRKENSVAQGNDPRERGKREDSWNSVLATQHSSFAVGIPAYIKKVSVYTLGTQAEYPERFFMTRHHFL